VAERISDIFLLCFLLYPFMGLSFFPRTDAGQFVINVKAPTGTRIELTDDYVKRVEDIVHQVVPPKELETIVSNIGLTPDLSSLFTPNSGMHTAFRSGGLEGRPQSQQLRLHGSGARAHRVARFPSCGRTFNPAAWWMRFSTRALRRRSMFR
jgi:multidrug efflux pump subunit AcrB